jgi:Holliday junction resolvase
MDIELLEIKQIIKDLALSQKETDAKFKETDAKFKDTDAKFKDTDAKFKDTDAKFKDTDAKFKETDKRIKAAFDLFEGQWGKLMESLVEGDLINILNERGIKVHETSMRRKGNHVGQNFEFDIIAHNGNEIVIVEVKTTLKTQDVKQFVDKLKKAKVYMQEYKEYTVFGATAYLRADSGSEVYAENEKLFVIKATGNSAHIINQDGFVPKGF